MTMPLPTFGLVCEGMTDHAVISRIIAGVFKNPDIETRPFQPLRDATAQGAGSTFGGWENVLNYLESPAFEEAFQSVEFVIVHIDSDVCQEPKFAVQTHDEGILQAPEVIIERIKARMEELISDEVLSRFGDRIIFAIAVDSTECWLITIHAVSDKRERYQNCLEHLNRDLSRSKLTPISINDKSVNLYGKLAKSFTKYKEIEIYRKSNKSLDAFIVELETKVSMPELP